MKWNGNVNSPHRKCNLLVLILILNLLIFIIYIASNILIDKYLDKEVIKNKLVAYCHTNFNCTLQLENINFNIFKGVVASDIKIIPDNIKNTSSSLSSKSLSFQVELFNLLKRKFLIKGLTFNELKIIIDKNTKLSIGNSSTGTASSKRQSLILESVNFKNSIIIIKNISKEPHIINFYGKIVYKNFTRGLLSLFNFNIFLNIKNITEKFHIGGIFNPATKKLASNFSGRLNIGSRIDALGTLESTDLNNFILNSQGNLHIKNFRYHIKSIIQMNIKKAIIKKLNISNGKSVINVNGQIINFLNPYLKLYVNGKNFHFNRSIKSFDINILADFNINITGNLKSRIQNIINGSANLQDISLNLPLFKYPVTSDKINLTYKNQTLTGFNAHLDCNNNNLYTKKFTFNLKNNNLNIDISGDEVDFNKLCKIIEFSDNTKSISNESTVPQIHSMISVKKLTFDNNTLNNINLSLSIINNKISISSGTFFIYNGKVNFKGEILNFKQADLSGTYRDINISKIDNRINIPIINPIINFRLTTIIGNSKDIFNNLRASGTFESDSIKYNKFTIKNLSGIYNIQDRIIDIKLQNSSFYKGKITANGSYLLWDENLKPQNEIKMNFVADKISMHDLYQEFKTSDKGIVDGYLKTSGSINFSLTNILRTISGNLKINMNKGLMQDTIVQQKFMNKLDFYQLDTLFIDSIEGNFQSKNGVIKIDNLKIDASEIKATLSGNYKLYSGDINIPLKLWFSKEFLNKYKPIKIISSFVTDQKDGGREKKFLISGNVKEFKID